MDGGGVLLERGRYSLTEAPGLEAAHAQGAVIDSSGPGPLYTLTLIMKRTHPLYAVTL